MTAPVFLAAPEALALSTPGGLVTLDGAEGRHAVSVRRLRVGEAIVLTDGAGTGVFGPVASVTGKDTLEVTVAELRHEPEPDLRITVIQALPKGDRGELAVETMTEVGVDAIVPWAASRCVTRWKDDRGAKALAKWRSAAREAGKQARRLRLPEVYDLMDTRGVVRLLREADLAAVLHEEGGSPLSAETLPVKGTIALVIGPEGGISPEEIDLFGAAGAATFRLGPTVLRTSTAGVAAASALLARTGRWG